MEVGAVVETLARQEDEVVDGVGDFSGVELQGDIAIGGVQDGGIGLLGVDLHFWGGGPLLCLVWHEKFPFRG